MSAPNNNLVRKDLAWLYINIAYANTITQLDRLVGLSMLVLATTVFLYYTVWTLLLVSPLHPVLTS